jgi:hypothetical protein
MTMTETMVVGSTTAAVTHPELIAAVRAVALATDHRDRLRVLEVEALRLAPLVARGDIAKTDAVDRLVEAAVVRDVRRDDAEHIVGMGLAGRSAGVAYVATCDRVGEHVDRGSAPAVGDYPCRRPTPQVVVEAVMYSVRTRGLAALDEPDTIERLGRCDAAAREQINQRIDALLARKECA